VSRKNQFLYFTCEFNIFRNITKTVKG